MPDSSDALIFPILLGDIGGTNARFSLLADASAEPTTFPIVQTASFPNIDDAIRDAVFERTAIRPRSVVLAVAGPVEGAEIALTNCDWVVRPEALIAELGFEAVVVLNDFEAQALAVAGLPEDGRVQIGPGEPAEGASRVVVGPGTGLGVAGLVRARGMWIPVAGEGGHVDLGPRTDRDRAIWPHLDAIEGRISAEQILCGRGLVNLYRAICAADGHSPVHTGPAAITQSAIEGGDPATGEAVDLFATYLGRLAGDLALVFMAKGGVYVAGGIFARLMPVLKREAFRSAFEDKAPHSALIGAIPLYVVTQPLAALAGLAAYASRPSSFGVETKGRRWSARSHDLR